jgi:hypothetical protein
MISYIGSMAGYSEYARKQIEREISHLKDQYDRLKRGKKKSNIDRIKVLEKQIREHNPNMKINYELLRLVGTEPYNPLSQDKEIVRRIVAERYD